MTYDFKKWPEFVWFIGVATVIAIAQILLDFRPETIQDWRLWTLSILGAGVRAGVAALIAMLTKPESS